MCQIKNPVAFIRLSTKPFEVFRGFLRSWRKYGLGSLRKSPHGGHFTYRPTSLVRKLALKPITTTTPILAHSAHYDSKIEAAYIASKQLTIRPSSFHRVFFFSDFLRLFNLLQTGKINSCKFSVDFI